MNTGEIHHLKHFGMVLPSDILGLAPTQMESTEMPQTIWRIQTNGPGLVEFTGEVLSWVGECRIETGLLTVFIRHTSASLVIQENADPDVLADLQAFFERLAPWDSLLYRHDTEGPDDMPAHIRAAMTQTSLSIPVARGRPVLGTWQGIYLWEHREQPHIREVVGHLSV